MNEQWLKNGWDNVYVICDDNELCHIVCSLFCAFGDKSRTDINKISLNYRLVMLCKKFAFYNDNGADYVLSWTILPTFYGDSWDGIKI